MIVWVIAVLKNTVCDDMDRCFDNPTPMMTSAAQVVETSVNVPSQDHTHPEGHALPTYDVTPGFKPFTKLKQFWQQVPLEIDISTHVQYSLTDTIRKSHYTTRTG